MKKFLTLTLAMVFVFNSIAYCGPFDFFTNLFKPKQPEIRTEIVEKEVIVKETEDRKAIEESIRKNLEKEYKNKYSEREHREDRYETSYTKDEEISKEENTNQEESKNVLDRNGYSYDRSEGYKTFDALELNDDTFSIDMKTGEQISSQYIPFYAEDKKRISLQLAYELVINNPNLQYHAVYNSTADQYEKLLNKISTYAGEGNKSCYFNKTNGAYSIHGVSKANPQYVQVDEYLTKLLPKVKAYEIKFNQWDPKKLEGKTLSFHFAEKLVTSCTLETFRDFDVEEWQANGMKSCKINNNHSEGYNFEPSSKEPEVN